MNVSKRTWILFGVAILAILAAFASLYLEKEDEIKTLESIEPDIPVLKSRVKKTEPIVEPETFAHVPVPADAAFKQKLNTDGNEEAK
jgi:hypothetical protein